MYIRVKSKKYVTIVANGQINPFALFVGQVVDCKAIPVFSAMILPGFVVTSFFIIHFINII